MIDILINEIEQAMLNVLDNEQLSQLRKVLDYTFRNVTVTEKESLHAESNNATLIDNFIAAKKVEGCSDPWRVWQSPYRPCLFLCDGNVCSSSTSACSLYTGSQWLSARCSPTLFLNQVLANIEKLRLRFQTVFIIICGKARKNLSV